MKKRILICLLFMSSFIIYSHNNAFKVIDIKGSFFKYTVEGKGFPCITFSGSENIGSRLYPKQFKQEVMLIHADPGNISPKQLKSLTLDSILIELDKVRKTLGLKKIAIMGHSMFGLLPFEYALKYPGKISFIISSGSAPFINGKYFKAAQLYWETKASQNRKQIHLKNLKKLKIQNSKNISSSQKFINQYLADIPKRFFNPQFDMTGIWEGVKLNIPFAYYFWGQLMKDFNNAKNYSKIENPVLIISGKYDFGAPYYLWEPIKKTISNSTFIIFEKAGHNPMLEQPEKFAKIVLNWVKKSRQ